MSYPPSSVRSEVKSFLASVNKKSDGKRQRLCANVPQHNALDDSAHIALDDSAPESIMSLDENLCAGSLSVMSIREDYPQDASTNGVYDSGAPLLNSANCNSSNPNEAKCNFSSELASWFVENHVSQLSANKLLKILKKKIPDLPNDVRTLIKTPSDVVKYSVEPGEYIHYGIKDYITDFLLREKYDNPDIYLNVNIDGLPLYKSSLKQAWPILININNTESVLVVGVFVGNSKPKQPDVYLKHFVDEMMILLSEGLHYVGKHFRIHLRAIICDAPARAYILGIKSHSGYFCCTKCTQRGERFECRIIFKLVNNVSERNDANFRSRYFQSHHKRLDSIVLEKLPIDMVASFPLDYMHVVCLGVVKSLLTYLVKIRAKPYSLNKMQISILNKRLINMRHQIPTEFNRKPRSIKELDRFKATEFRTFLLYTGPVYLLGCIDTKKYEHFLLLSLAIRLLLCSESCKKHAYLACAMLRDFISKIPDLYSNTMLSYNFHCLLHLASDAERFSSLESISAFKFENYMRHLKKFVRKSEHAATQIYRRLVERSHISLPFTEFESLTFGTIKEGFSDRVKYKHFNFGTKNRDSFYFIKSGQKIEIYKISKIEKCNETCIFHSNSVLNLTDLFHLPIKSSLLGIFKSNSLDLDSAVVKHSIEKISGKIVCLSDRSQHIYIPFIH